MQPSQKTMAFVFSQSPSSQTAHLLSGSSPACVSPLTAAAELDRGRCVCGGLGFGFGIRFSSACHSFSILVMVISNTSLVMASSSFCLR